MLVFYSHPCAAPYSPEILSEILVDSPLLPGFASFLFNQSCKCKSIFVTLKIELTPAFRVAEECVYCSPFLCLTKPRAGEARNEEKGRGGELAAAGGTQLRTAGTSWPDRPGAPGAPEEQSQVPVT